MKLVDKDIKPNSKTYISMKVTTDLDGGDIAIPVHVIAGGKPGPTLALFHLLHGSEWFFIETMRKIVQETQPSGLAGTMIIVPVANPVAFGNYLNRTTRDESDNAGDLNRVFPGEYKWTAEQLASKLVNEILAKSDCLIDFHAGIWGSAIGAIMCGTDYSDEGVVKLSEEIAKIFGYPCIQRAKVMSAHPGPRSSTGYFGGVLGKPCIVAEVGGAGFDEVLEQKWTDMNLTGVENVMKHLRMLEGEPKLPEEYLVWEKRWRVVSSVGGILVPKIPPDSLMREVEKGDLLGQVVSPYSFEVVEELRSPGKGIIFMSARMYPVRPGDWAFAIVNMEDRSTRWVSR